jgi:hypothetical protein
MGIPGIKTWVRPKQNKKQSKISIFSNSSHFEWRAGLSDTILKGDHPRTIPAKFALIWFSGFSTNKQSKYQLETTKRYHGNTWNKNMGKTNPTNITYLCNEKIHTYLYAFA